jgi:hypothetical protein
MPPALSGLAPSAGLGAGAAAGRDRPAWLVSDPDFLLNADAEGYGGLGSRCGQWSVVELSCRGFGNIQYPIPPFFPPRGGVIRPALVRLCDLLLPRAI